MRKNELSAWSLLVGAAFMGSIATAMIGGCNPPTASTVESTSEVATRSEAPAAAETSAADIPERPSEIV